MIGFTFLKTAVFTTNKGTSSTSGASMKRVVTTTMTVFISKGLFVMARTDLKKHSAIRKSKISQVSTTRMGFTS